MTPILELQDLSFRYEGELPGEKVLDALTFETPKTREMAKVLTAIGATKKTLLVLPGKDETIYRVSNNIPGLEVAFVNTINVLDIMKCDKFVVLKDAVAQIEEVYA